MRIPTETHYAAIVTRRRTVPGDERSRLVPGHGYPEHTVEDIDYIAFENKEAMTDWINRQRYTEFTIIHATPLNYETRTIINE